MLREDGMIVHHEEPLSKNVPLLHVCVKSHTGGTMRRVFVAVSARHFEFLPLANSWR